MYTKFGDPRFNNFSFIMQKDISTYPSTDNSR